MWSLVLAVLVAMTVVMIGGWAFQRRKQNGGWTDVFWTFGTGATCALAALAPLGDLSGPLWRRAMVALMMALWAIRLGGYVAARVSRSAEDVRYATLRREWGGRFQTWMFGLLVIQAPITAVVSIAVIYAARDPDPGFRLRDLAGLLVFLAAIAGETLADRQMTRFKAEPEHGGKVCDIGLWAWSRHPNYFFEALIWIAYPLIGLHLDRPWTLTSLLGPLMMFWIVRYGTGVPPLEKAMVQSKGDAYRRYQARVSPLLPWFPKAETDAA